MASSFSYSLTSTRLTESSNLMKEAFLKKMVSEEIITTDQEAAMNKYCVVLAEKGFFGKIWDKIFWNDGSERLLIMVVKVLE